MTEPYEPIGPASEVPEGALKRVTVGELDLTVANTGSGYFAFQSLCTHRQCALEEGELEGSTLECACHGAKFDVTSGAVLNGPAIAPLETYATRVENGELEIGT